jgi:hypothetical protein
MLPTSTATWRSKTQIIIAIDRDKARAMRVSAKTFDPNIDAFFAAIGCGSPIGSLITGSSPGAADVAPAPLTLHSSMSRT